jgi:SAM-dependent methyltransferase
MDKRAAWDRFWSYDRLSSFGTGKGAGNYGGDIAAGWRAFFAALPAGARVLDVATGNGAIALMAVEAGKKLDVTGADLAAIRPAAFASSRQRDLKKIRFLAETAAEDLPIEDGSIDAVVSQYGIEYSDLKKSVPETVRVVSPAGRLRFACHAAEGSLAADTKLAIADADFLLDDLDLTGRAARCLDAVLGVERGRQSGQFAEIAAQARYADFRDGLKAVADRLPAAADQAMLGSVHQSLVTLFEQRHAQGLQDLFITIDALHEEIAAHRERQRALLAAARSAKQMAALTTKLENLGLADITLGEQRDGGSLIGHVIEARRP